MSTAVIDFESSRIRRGEVPSGQRGRRPGASAQKTPVAQRVTSGEQIGTRLTRRGRLVLVATVLVLAFVAFMVLSAPALSSGEAHHAAPNSVVVAAGETLWDIAQRIAPGQDPRDVIAEIVDLNALSDAGTIRVGQKLDVPAG